jgi:hypothetical protein
MLWISVGWLRHVVAVVARVVLAAWVPRLVHDGE